MQRLKCHNIDMVWLQIYLKRKYSVKQEFWHSNLFNLCVLIVFIIHIKQDTAVFVCELKDILEESHLLLLHYYYIIIIKSLNTSFKLLFVLLLFFCLSVLFYFFTILTSWNLTWEDFTCCLWWLLMPVLNTPSGAPDVTWDHRGFGVF